MAEWVETHRKKSETKYVGQRFVLRANQWEWYVNSTASAVRLSALKTEGAGCTTMLVRYLPAYTASHICRWYFMYVFDLFKLSHIL
jgi:hypothetical protein